MAAVTGIRRLEIYYGHPDGGIRVIAAGKALGVYDGWEYHSAGPTLFLKRGWGGDRVEAREIVFTDVRREEAPRVGSAWGGG